MFNETIDAFISANRDGFHLMDVDTAPLLVKRRGMKRRLADNDISNNNIFQHKQTEASNLTSVSEDLEQIQMSIEDDNKLIFQQESFEKEIPQSTTSNNNTPNTAAFKEYRDTRPSYLKYSRDDMDSEKLIEKKK